MAITLTTAQRTALQSGRLVARHGVLIELDSGDYAFWQGLGSFTYDSVTYLGIGQMGTVQPLAQSSGLVASGLELVLSGLDQDGAADDGDLYTVLDDEDFHGRPVSLYRFYFDPDKARKSAAELILAERLFKGFMDRVERDEVAVLNEAGDGTLSSELRVYCESRAIEYGRNHLTMRSNEHQQRLFSGDKGFEFTPDMARREFYWGRLPQSVGGGSVRPPDTGGETSVLR